MTITENKSISLRYPGFKTHAVTLSYDDGRHFDRKMVEILDRYGLKCTFNLNSRVLYSGSDAYVTAQELPTLYQNHEVAVHTLTHPHLDMLDPGRISYEVTADRKNLEDILHRPVQGMAYPFGLREYPGLVDTVKSCGIRYSRTTVSSCGFGLPTDPLRWHPTCHHSHPHLPDFIAQFRNPVHPWDQIKLLYIWGHSYEYEHDWSALEKLCQEIGGNDSYWYATNIEILDYLDAYRSLRVSVDSRFVYNPSSVPLYVVAEGQERVLEPGTLTEI